MQCGQHWIFWVTQLPSCWTETYAKQSFIAGWAYAKRILSLAEHMIAGWACAEMFKSWISQPNRLQCSKISCYRPLRPWGFVFCKKSVLKISCLCTYNEVIFVCSVANIGYFVWHDCHPVGQRAYGEQISSLAEHTRNLFHRWLSMRRNV